MTDPTHLRYVYYHCTKKGTAPCRERAVREEELDAQIERALHRIALPARIAEWAMQALRTEETKDSEAAAAADDALRTRLTTVGREIEHLNRIVMSPDTDWSLVSQGEVRQRKHALLGEQERLASEVQGRTRADERSIELTERTFVIAAAACSWFKAGNAAVRKKLVGAIGSNPTLAARKLEFPLRKPFLEVTKMAAAVRNAEARIEPTSDRSTKTPFPFWWVVRPCLLGSRNVVRTYWREAGPLETLSDLQFLTGDPRAGAKSPRRSRRR
jgi:hypothetical protein